MRGLIVLFIALLVGPGACADHASVSSGTALVDVTVIDLDRASVDSAMTVVVDGSRITHVAPTADLRLGDDVRRIHLAGTYILPGLWDMHAHTYADEEARAVFLPAFIAHGVTGIREMFSDCYEACAGSNARDLRDLSEIRHPSASMVQTWQDDVEAGRMAGPRIVRSSYFIAGRARDLPFPLPTWPSSRVVEGLAEAREAVLESAARGVDFIKIYGDLGREEFFEIARVADSLALPLSGHVPYAISPTEASDAGMDSFEHGLRLVDYCVRDVEPADAGADGWSPAERLRHLGSPRQCLDTFHTMAANGTYLVPTLTVIRAMVDSRVSPAASDPQRRYLPAHILDRWDARSQAVPDPALDFAHAIHDAVAAIVPVAYEAGVAILAGSDTPNPYVYPGAGLHDELAELVEAGLTPLDALRAATAVPARYLDGEADLGSVAVGKLADLVVLSENPLEDISRTRSIQLVVANGRVYTRTDLDRLLAEMERYSASR